MARWSLAAPVVLVTANCLVTSTPTLTDPPQEPPYILATGATPDPRAQKLVPTDTLLVQFSATIVTHDPNEVVQIELLTDYGFDSASGFKARGKEPISTVPGGSLVRHVTKDWYPSDVPNLSTEAGCHTVTMLVSHAFDSDTGCPLRLCDSSQLTWYVEFGGDVCLMAAANNAAAQAKCLTCPAPTDTCPSDSLPATASQAQRDALHQAYHCPSDDDATAGTP